MAILRRFTPRVEQISIDEAFLDVAGSEPLFGPPEEIARRIRAAIRDELQLTASVGVATTKLVAKVASDLRKPDALVVVPPGDEATFLAPLGIERLWGVGPRDSRRACRLRRAHDRRPRAPARRHPGAPLRPTWPGARWRGRCGVDPVAGG